MDFLKKLGIKSENPGASCGDGTWLTSATSKHVIVSEDPATGKEIASVHGVTPHEYEQVIKSAKQRFDSWRQVPAPKRGELVRMIGERLREHKEYLGSLVAYEMGKSKQEGDGEVQEMIDMADFAVGLSRMLYGLTMHSERPMHRMYEQWHPLGVVGVITAFNFPVAVWAWNAFIAAVCGNTVVWKPSSKVPLCAIAVQHICNQVMQEQGFAGIFSLFIPQSRDLSEQFLQDERISLISFTGSTAVGKHVNQVLAKRLGRVLLELGGNNAIIVDETADLDLAIPAIVFGAVGTAGQRCTTTRRLLVQQSCYDEVVKRLIHAYHQITIGSPLEPKNLMGPLIDKQAVEQYVQAIQSIKAQGGEILWGGKVIPGPGYFVEPTLVKAENTWPIVQQETFSPILYVIPYQSLEEAIVMQNAVSQGLSSALFTNSLRHSEQYLSAIGSDCGIANINIGTSGAEIGGAFGGEKETGGGREAGSDAWKAYMRRQTNTINWGKTLPLAQGIQFKLKT
ncbi:L-piperidine-6-carboxylate dehydrogenase [Candidatus Berkiella aquae]|uniref:aldehyde dehydrogenase (NAD(+)) n=1 Tax=Candidatus Berkiella aquae TaxID=295108 RepID=A0A0Q9YI96_9GAMM|nr:aldehyde dehydrogenase family protein [Candidatus Berkiella aquae]MCS5712275.1 aldehyde dehydrogenase family protein [Candidatus Berkiella aquae]